MALIDNGDQLDLIENFTTDLEKSFGVKRRLLSFDALWNDSPPGEAKGESLQDFMKFVSVQFQKYVNYFMLSGLSKLLFPRRLPQLRTV